jgi:hypothetical protein
MESESAGFHCGINYSHPDEWLTSCCISPVKDIAVFHREAAHLCEANKKMGQRCIMSVPF